MTDDFDELKQNISVRSTWVRLFFMLLFGIVFWIAELVVWLVTVFQFLHALFTTRANDNLRHFGRSLATYVSEIVLFLSYNTEDMPFPFSDWPEGDEGAKKAPGARRASKGRKASAKPKSASDPDDDSDSAGA